MLASSAMIKDENKKTIEDTFLFVATLFALGIMLLSMPTMYLFMSHKGFHNYYLLANFFNYFAVIGSCFILTAIIFARKITVLSADQQKQLELKNLVKSYQNLVRMYADTQHEFLNHLQIIMGFIQLGKSDQALDFIREFQSRCRAGLTITKLRRPEIGGLMATFITSPEGESIAFDFSITSSWEEVPFNFNDLSTIVGNLINNAVYEANKSLEKKVYVRFDMDESNYVLVVANSGNPIEVETTEKIFERGFTTKDNSSGLGLYNVRQVLQRLGGSVFLVSHNDFPICFQVLIPKQ